MHQMALKVFLNVIKVDLFFKINFSTVKHIEIFNTFSYIFQHIDICSHIHFCLTGLLQGHRRVLF